MKIRISAEKETRVYCPDCDKFICDTDEEVDLLFEDIERSGRTSDIRSFDPEDLIGKRITWIEESTELEHALILTLE